LEAGGIACERAWLSKKKSTTDFATRRLGMVQSTYQLEAAPALLRQ
jgi:hypothetical protein